MKKKLTISLCILLIVGWAATGIAFYREHQENAALIRGLNHTKKHSGCTNLNACGRMQVP